MSTLTGPVPGLFTGAKDGTEAFAAYINSLGGICGRKLVVDAADDDFDPAQNSTATQSLANSVLAFVGSFSIYDEGGASVLASDGIPDVSEAITTQANNLPNNFSPQPDPPGWTRSPFAYFAQRFGTAVTQHMAFFAEEGTSKPEEQEVAMESLGYKFVYSEDNIQATQTDFTPEVEAMKAHGVTGLVFQAPASIAGTMAKDMYDEGLSIPFADWGQPSYDSAFVATAGPGANGAVLYLPTAMFEGQDAGSVPEVGVFDKWYQALYGSEPDLYAAYAWMAGMLFVEGLNAGGAPTRAALMSGLKLITNFTADGISAPDNPASKSPPNCYIVVDVVNGNFVRDSADPRSGFRCSPDVSYDSNNG